MTHADIYIKFMIEYDKANVTSSYPSLTEYEVATVLDKAYNALIAQKITGNNFRRSTFESDVKAIADLQPLIVNTTLDERKETADNFSGLDYSIASNVHTYNLPMTEKGKEFLYFLQCYVAKPNRQIDEDGNLNLAVSYLNNKTSEKEVEDYFYTLSTALLIEPTATDLSYSVYELASAPVLNGNDLDENTIIHVNVSGNLLTQGNKLIMLASNSDQATDRALVIEEGTVVESGTTSSEIVYNYDPADWSDTPYIRFALQDELQGDEDEIDFQLTISHKEKQELFVLPIKLLNHELANQFYVTGHNLPWVKDPVCYLENNDLIVVSDALDMPNNNKVQLIYIKKPNLFVKSEEELDAILNRTIQPTEGNPLTNNADAGQFSVTDRDNNTIVDRTEDFDRYKFELNDTMAEELISLAIAFALENVESPRLNSRLNMRGLEA